MSDVDVQGLCEAGQQALIETRYLDARRLLLEAEAAAWGSLDFDTLSRLYLPLQEARRQIRQRCGEGVIELALIAGGPGTAVDPELIVDRYPQGQILVAGWDDVTAAAAVRAAVGERYLEVFLASVDPATGRIGVYPMADGPAGFVLDRAELPESAGRGTVQTYALTMSWWERLAAPFLAAADAEGDPMVKMQKYRRTIEVDSACELAHQGLADVARRIARERI